MSVKSRTIVNGFTIVEVAIVLTVCGLTIAGILVGKSLIHNGELQSVVADVQRFRQAAKLFRDKYKYLPGDFPKAEEFWGGLVGCPVPANGSPPTRSTCNGTGDGFIGGLQSTPSTISGSQQEIRETLHVWQHLANAGFISGTFSGAGSATGGLAPGVNIAAGALDQSAYTLHYGSPYSSSSLFYPAEYHHVLVFGCAKCPVPSLMAMGNPTYLTIAQPVIVPILTSRDALAVDTKADDGRPGTGSVLSYKPSLMATQNCAASAGRYKTAYADVACSLIFVTGF